MVTQVEQSIMKALGCRKDVDKLFVDQTAFCVWHQCRWDLSRDCCLLAARAADAAFGPSLEWAAERWEQDAKVLEDQEHAADLADECLSSADTLRRWARGYL
jgi:hypothetical protein